MCPLRGGWCQSPPHELLRPLMIATRQRDIPKNHQRPAALYDLIAGVRGLQSIHRSRARLVKVVTFVRRERLHEQREDESTHASSLPSRQRLRRAGGRLDLSSLKMIHVAQANERDGSEPCWCVYANSERSLEPDTPFFEQAAQLGPKPEERARELKPLLHVRRRAQAPFEGRADVLLFDA